ncbi:hypothetical protein CFIMG_007710RA00001 [Ceratocystis fimbriata CBS 114723]|uniref:Uncharacterized protein n=1 Tax=Ceratocystis fimbriata CBS 114723 TaxID=1035309 RepID=A0A2C5WUS3_9PEZI|nr:hypothetical protein CFIMG_007710RA00001 [Ceratocystis fimbriata CBS 114723]
MGVPSSSNSSISDSAECTPLPFLNVRAFFRVAVFRLPTALLSPELVVLAGRFARLLGPGAAEFAEADTAADAGIGPEADMDTAAGSDLDTGADMTPGTGMPF